MSDSDLPSLAGAEWLAAPATRALLEVLDRDGEEARVIGGAVRNTLLGETVQEVDIATTALPETVIARVEAAGFKAVPTGVEHGTVTVVVDKIPFEVTTLREDVETFGRHAQVRFGRDWTADAHRRDFTMNTLSVDRHGRLHDPAQGYGDCMARQVRFVGDADLRVREDYLRILRFFRFHARYGDGTPDAEGYAAAVRGRDGLRQLSAERIAQEMRRLVVAPGAAPTLALMSEAGLVEIVFEGMAWPQRVARLARMEEARDLEPSPALRLAAAGAATVEDADRIAAHLKLSKAEALEMRAAVDAVWHFPVEPGAPARQLLYRLGRPVFRNAALLAFAGGREAPDEAPWPALLDLAETGEIPVFPLTGKHLVKRGHPPGPDLGAELARLETVWVDSDFSLDRAALLALAEIPGPAG
ncbi:CCA tRNA nucleotidyltransferase [Amorphus coralli]|uniref:CCA tRNA nucleotidyltransferase n=1 Tax=Amorphus coralli TaxID=340680 RepID=UPI00036CB2E3|nr:CCA tRNA nucleotidyltransferase [Amorphus coralli]